MKIENIKKYNSAPNMTKTLGSVSKYTWAISLVLLCSYIYFVGAITFSVVKQKSLASENKELISDMSKAEVAYLDHQRTLTEEYASSLGFVKDSKVAFSEAKRAFAWNVGR